MIENERNSCVQSSKLGQEPIWHGSANWVKSYVIRGFSTHWNCLNDILPTWAHLGRNLGVRSVSPMQQAGQMRHVRPSQTAVHTYTRQMQR
jgi:hypothetical protein